MLENSSDKPPELSPARPSRRWWALLYVPAWVVFSFAAAQVVVGILVQLLVWLGVPLKQLDSAVLQTSVAGLIYAISLVIVIGAPWWLKKVRTSREVLGLTRLPRWTDILLAPAAFIIYGLISAILLAVISYFLSGVDWTQVQQVGFDSLHARYEYILAFTTLVIVAPIAEETLFRGYLFGNLKRRVPVWLAILVTSLIFGALHLGITAPLQWNVALDTFALSIILCGLRLITGSIWAGILLHILKNGIAYYILFVDQSLLRMIGG